MAIGQEREHPDVMMIAEETYMGQKITGPKIWTGFDYKWNMGWMNDILIHEEDPIYRNLTLTGNLSLLYVFSKILTTILL